MSELSQKVPRDQMFYRFSAYGFLKNLRFFEPFILLIFRSYGLSFLQIGVLYSVRDLATNLLEIPTGVLADSFGRRRAMVSSFLAYILCFFLLFIFKTYWILIAAMIIFAVGEAFRSGTHKALILEYLKIKNISHLKIAYYGLTRSASQLGSAVNALIAAALVFSTGSYRMIFLASIVPYALDLANLALYPKQLDGQITSVNEKEIWERISSTLAGFFNIFRDSKKLRTLLNSASCTAAFKTTKDYLQPVLAAWALSISFLSALEDNRREALVIGFVYFCIYILTSLASREAYQISNHLKTPKAAVNITYLVAVVLLLGSGVTASLEWQLLTVLCFIGMFLINNVRRPINVGVISDQISSKLMASGLSAEALMTTIFSAVFAPLLGYLVDMLGLGNGISLLGLLMFALFIPFRVLDAGIDR